MGYVSDSEDYFFDEVPVTADNAVVNVIESEDTGFYSDNTQDSDDSDTESIDLEDYEHMAFNSDDEFVVMPDDINSAFSDPARSESLLADAIALKNFPIFEHAIELLGDISQRLISALVMSQVNEELDPEWTYLRELLHILPVGSVDTVFSEGQSLLARAASMNSPQGHKLLEILLQEFQANPDTVFLSSSGTWRTAIFYCSSHQSCAALAAAGANVNFMEQSTEGIEIGTALHLAVREHRYHMVPALLFDAKISPELRNGEGQRAIELATKINNTNAAKCLNSFSKCSDTFSCIDLPKAKRIKREKPAWTAPDLAHFLPEPKPVALLSVAKLLEYALYNENDDLANFIMDRPAVCDNFQHFIELLHAALKADSFWATEKLFKIACQCFNNAPFTFNESQQLLIWAVKANAYRTVTELLTSLPYCFRFNPNATVHKINHLGEPYRRPLIDLASSEEMLETLALCGADFEIGYSDADGYFASLFIRAVRNGQADLVRKLIFLAPHLHSDASSFDSTGNTPAHYAQQSDSQYIRDVFGIE